MELGYFHNHEHKMDYPRYVTNGWQVGSGPVEPARIRAVTQRLKWERACGGANKDPPPSATCKRYSFAKTVAGTILGSQEPPTKLTPTVSGTQCVSIIHFISPITPWVKCSVTKRVSEMNSDKSLRRND